MESLKVFRNTNKIRCFTARISLESLHYIAACEKLRAHLEISRTLEEAGDSVMRSYMIRAVQKDEYGTSIEAIPLNDV